MLHLLLLVIAILIFKSLKQETRSPRPLYKPDVIYSDQPRLITNKQNQNNVNKSNRKLRFVGRCNNKNYKNNMIAGDRLRNDSIIFIVPGKSGPYSNNYYEPSDDSEPISTETGNRGQEMHHFGNNTHSNKHGNCANDWQSPSHHSHFHSHDTHLSPTYSTSHHGTHINSHDTHTSSHDTHNYDRCDSGGDGCDSGGGGDSGRDCGGGDD